MNKRSTIQRTIIFETVKELSFHPTADDIYDHIQVKYPNISRGTVYRNLSVLTDAGEISKVKIPDGAVRYDHQCHKHYHAQCCECGRVFDVDVDYIEDPIKKIKDSHGFVYTGYDIVFTGVCSECNKNERNDKI